MIFEWQKVNLEAVYDGLYDGPHATPKESESGAIFLGIKNVTEDGRLDLSDIRYIAEDDFATWTRRVTPQKDDIVFSYEATLHRYAKIPANFRGCLGRRMALIRPNKKKVNVDFLFHYFLSPLWKSEVEGNILSGSTVDRIPLTNVPRFEIYLPPLQIQQKIAAILSAYDDLIENNLQRIKLLEEMAQITYEEWFVRMKFPGHETAQWDKETGLPDGWAKIPLGNMMIFHYGKGLRSHEKREGKVPIYSSAGIFGYHDVSLVDAPGIIVGRKGNVGSVFWSQEPFFPMDTTYYVESKESLYFAYFALKSVEFINNDAAVPGLNRNAAYAMKIISPISELIDRFEEKVKPTFITVFNLKKQNELLREAREILLPRLMTGVMDVDQVEVPEALLARVA
ncbi:MAG: restriction endonuclease subunit S [Candidatus Thiothrix sulfatifontis]|nr:MAG: restriction endonuclease subunit S [Candidatus Thiothrix sulfatifontis]